jgi:hypothetical protein
MPRILTQKDFARNKQIEFCYLCGKALNDGQPTNHDHCPPKSIFRPEDRSDYPIVLEVHEKCNHEKHLSDEMLSVIFDPLSDQGKVSKAMHQKQMQKRKVIIGSPENRLEGYTDLPLRPFASRIVQCMHAILYKEYFPNGVIKGEVVYPFAELSQDGEWISSKHRGQSLAIARTIAGSIKAGTFDCVVAYNAQFKYVCCWLPYDDKPACFYAFDIMNMARLAGTVTGLPRVVVGHYVMAFPASEHSRAISIEVPLTSDELEYPLPTLGKKTR